MQTTSALYKSIVSADDVTNPHWFETRITIKDTGGTARTMGEDEIFSLDRSRPGMSQNYPSVGGALSSTLKLTVLYPSFDIPKMAEIKVYYRAVTRGDTATEAVISQDILSVLNYASVVDDILVFEPRHGVSVTNDILTFPSGQSESYIYSEWLPAGTYHIDTRAQNKSYAIDTLDITAFDAMMKAESDYPNTNHAWPYKDTYVVAEIASQIGVTVDSRTYDFLTAGYMINPPTDYVMREVLEHIAAMYGGNFVITAENKLLFVPLYGLDPEENLTGTYLRIEGGTEALTFGNEGWYILV